MRRYLVLGLDSGRPVFQAIDEDGNCFKYHDTDQRRRFHLMVNAKGERTALICPVNLTIPERARILADDPPGSLMEQARKVASGIEEGRKISFMPD